MALGALWIFIGAAAAVLDEISRFALTRGNFDENGANVLLAMLGVAGVIWIALGVCACLEQTWALYVGLALSYLSLVSSLFRLQICSLVLLGVVIFQAHRVLRRAKELRAAGIPLTTRPEDLLA